MGYYFVNSSATQTARRPKATMLSYCLNILHLRNPWVIAWWSLVFPGFGHLACGSIAKGIFMFIGELVLNYMAKINLAIIYSFIGEFEKAKTVLNIQWLLLYCAVLVFAIWDSYRITIEINKFSVLGDRENAPLTTAIVGGAAINFLDKRTPWLALAWSLLAPGIGQLYNLQTIKAVFLLIISACVIIASHALQAVHFTFIGDFQQAKAVVDWQLFLNIPSFYCFAAWDAYVDAVEINKLFEIEQAQYFRSKFQNQAFKKPLPKQEG